MICRRMCSVSTPSLVYRVKIFGHSCNCVSYWSDPLKKIGGFYRAEIGQLRHTAGRTGMQGTRKLADGEVIPTIG